MFGEVKNPEGVGNIYTIHINLVTGVQKATPGKVIGGFNLTLVYIPGCWKKLDIIRTILIYSDERNS